MIPTMCEQFDARAAQPFRLDELWPLATAMERYGIAGFGWGITWLGADPRGRFAFAHDGDVAAWRPVLTRCRDQGRISDRADSEVARAGSSRPARHEQARV